MRREGEISPFVFEDTALTGQSIWLQIEFLIKGNKLYARKKWL
jgi:hypothetical protein